MLQKIKFKNVVAVLVLLHCILFVSLYLSLSYYNRLGRDEGLCIYFLNKLGLIGTIQHYYLSQEGNFSSIIIATVLLQILKTHANILVFHVVILALLYLSIYLFLTRLYKLGLVGTSRFYQITIPLLLLSAFFLLNPKVSEVWFWLGAMTVYLVPIVLLLLGCYFLFSDSKLAKGIAFLIFLFFGGTKINYGIMAASVFGVYFLYEAIFNKKIDRNTIIALLGIAFGSIIYVVAPGNLTRMTKEAIEINWHSLWRATKFNVHYVFTDFLAPGRMIRLAVLMVPLLLAGIKLKDKNLNDFLFTRNTMLFIVILNVGLIIENCLVYFLPTGEGVIFPRVMTINFFIVILSFAFCFSYLGSKVEGYMDSIVIKIIVLVLLLYPLNAYLKSFTTELYKAKALAESFDKRVQLLNSYKGKQIPGGILYLDSLSEHGITNSLEISADTANQDNEQYELRYGLNFKIAVKSRANAR